MFLPRKEDRILLVIGLALALATYFYLSDSIRRTRRDPIDSSYKLIKPTAASVPVRVRFASRPPEGYQLIQDRVTVSPSSIVVIAPEALLEEISSAETAIIDISKSTKKFVKSVQIESVAGIPLSGEPQAVDVVVPIEKLEPNI